MAKERRNKPKPVTASEIGARKKAARDREDKAIEKKQIIYQQRNKSENPTVNIAASAAMKERIESDRAQRRPNQGFSATDIKEIQKGQRNTGGGIVLPQSSAQGGTMFNDTASLIPSGGVETWDPVANNLVERTVNRRRAVMTKSGVKLAKGTPYNETVTPAVVKNTGGAKVTEDQAELDRKARHDALVGTEEGRAYLARMSESERAPLLRSVGYTGPLLPTTEKPSIADIAKSLTKESKKIGTDPVKTQKQAEDMKAKD